MKQLIILITLLSNFLFAYEFKLNEKDYKTINNSNKKSFIEKRLQKYNELKVKIENYDLIRKLSHTNTFINKILPQFDNKSSGIDDYWATPKEFLINGHGDCEDYAIAKYFSLVKLGVPEDKLRITYVTYRGKGNFDQAHMVLTYYHTPTATPVVLDNIDKTLQLATNRDDLTPIYSFNALGLWQAKNKGEAKIGDNNLKSWKDLMSRF